MLFYGRSICDTGLISLALQRQMSCPPLNIALAGMGVRVKRTDEEVERSMVVYHIFVSVPRTFGGYCRLEITRKSFSHKGAKVWNDTPNKITDAESILLFKKQLRNYLLGQ